MGRRGLLVILAVVALASAVALFVVRRHAPPRSATLLPPSEGVLYVDIELLRKAGVFNNNHPVQRDPDFEEFVKQTGFDFERDLDEAAFSLHNPATAARGDDYPRFSEAFIGRIDVPRASDYLKKLSASSEQYHDETIFSIPHENRIVRVALIDNHTAVASNTETADAIHAMIDTAKRAGTGHPLLDRYYKTVPVASIAWFIANVAPAPGFGARGLEGMKSGLHSPSWLRDIAGGSTVVASLRFLTKLELRVVANAPSEADAQRIAQNTNAWLAVFRTLQSGLQTSGTDPDVKAAFDSIRVEQDKNEATLRADVPAAVLKKLAAEPPSVTGAPTPSPQTPAPNAIPQDQRRENQKAPTKSAPKK